MSKRGGRGGSRNYHNSNGRSGGESTNSNLDQALDMYDHFNAACTAFDFCQNAKFKKYFKLANIPYLLPLITITIFLDYNRIIRA